MSALEPRDAERFGKLLGLLGSNHDGERAAAALKATEFLRARRMGWTDIGEALKRPPVVYQPPQTPTATRDHHEDALYCLGSKLLNKVEADRELKRAISEMEVAA